MYFRGLRRKRDMASLATAVRLGNARDKEFRKIVKDWIEE